ERPAASVAITLSGWPGSAATVEVHDPLALMVTGVDVAAVVLFFTTTVMGVMPVSASAAPCTVAVVAVAVTVSSNSLRIGGVATLPMAVSPSSVATYIAPRLRATLHADPGTGCEAMRRGSD